MLTSTSLFQIMQQFMLAMVLNTDNVQSEALIQKKRTLKTKKLHLVTTAVFLNLEFYFCA